MAIIAESVPSTWFDKLTMTGHPEPVEGYNTVSANNYFAVYRNIRTIIQELLNDRFWDPGLTGGKYVYRDC
jgi:hypothetical protein